MGRVLGGVVSATPVLVSRERSGPPRSLSPSPSPAMKQSRVFASLSALGLLFACGQENQGAPAGEPASGVPEALPGIPVAAPLEAVDPGTVVAKVGEEEITEGEVQERLAILVAQRTGGQGMPPELMAQFRQSMGPGVVDALIDETLLDAQVTEAGVELTEADYEAQFRGDLETWMLYEGLDREDFAERIESAEGVSVDEFIGSRSKDDAFRRSVRHMRLLAQVYPERGEVTPDDVQESYDTNLATVWTRPAMVQASHILFEIPEDDEEAAAAKRAEAERVLALARAEGADFAALAKQHSEGPSGPQGGDLGSFPREGVMVEPFAAAAFELEPGQVSDLVETQFGLHIIRVGKRTEEVVIPFDEASEAIRWRLRAERMASLRPEYLEDLRPDAKIERL